MLQRKRFHPRASGQPHCSTTDFGHHGCAQTDGRRAWKLPWQQSRPRVRTVAENRPVEASIPAPVAATGKAEQTYSAKGHAGVACGG
jgi:hypothetical protein